MAINNFNVLLALAIIPDNNLSRFGCSPLDDAIRHGNAVAALALERAGGLQSRDPRLALQVSGSREARTRWWRNAREKTVAEAVARSPESMLWSSSEQHFLPPLLSLLERINKIQEKLETDITKALKTLQCTFERVVILTAQQEQTPPFGWQQAGCFEGFIRNHNFFDDMNMDTRTQADGAEDACGGISEIGCALALALESISGFFNQEMEVAKEAMSFESLTRGRYLQPSCARFSRSIQSLRAQVNFDSWQTLHAQPFCPIPCPTCPFLFSHVIIV